jgi:hypothetical protein
MDVQVSSRALQAAAAESLASCTAAATRAAAASPNGQNNTNSSCRQQQSAHMMGQGWMYCFDIPRHVYSTAANVAICGVALLRWNRPAD